MFCFILEHYQIDIVDKTKDAWKRVVMMIVM